MCAGGCDAGGGVDGGAIGGAGWGALCAIGGGGICAGGGGGTGRCGAICGGIDATWGGVGREGGGREGDGGEGGGGGGGAGSVLGVKSSGLATTVSTAWTEATDDTTAMDAASVSGSAVGAGVRA